MQLIVVGGKLQTIPCDMIRENYRRNLIFPSPSFLHAVVCALVEFLIWVIEFSIAVSTRNLLFV